MPESTKSPAEVLGAAADLLEKPGAWTQGAHARNAAGAPMLVGSRMDAVCWCVLGALDRMAPTNNLWDASVQAMNEVVGHVADFNDAPERTQAEVVAALREAARQASIRGGEA